MTLASDRTITRDTDLRRALEHAAVGPGGISFMSVDGSVTRWRYSDLLASADQVAGSLGNRGVTPGTVVCLLGRTSPGFLSVLLGVWRAGATAAILPLPVRDLGGYAQEVERRARVVSASLVAVEDDLLGMLKQLPGPIAGFAELTAGAAAVDPGVVVGSDSLALLQFTSGTTALSRAVPLRHGQLLGNVLTVADEAGLGRSDVLVSWLPLFHDMGVIGLAGGLARGMDICLMSPDTFTQRPGLWLDAIDRFGGSITAAPNFGYGLAARELLLNPRRLDLSTMRVAMNGAEPIDPTVVRAFMDAVTPHGFPECAMSPMYGLAEATLAVTAVNTTEPLRVLPAGTGPKGAPERDLVACGRPLPGTELRVVDVAAESDEPVDLGPDVVGEIVVRGPGVMSGYVGDSSGGLAIRQGWLTTGDLGFLHDGEVYVCGRLKDVIFVGGRNIYPEDYELATEAVPGVRRGNVIAYRDASGDGLVVAAETKEPQEALPDLARRIVEAIAAAVGGTPTAVVLLPAATLPKTSSGKKQRARCRDLDTAGQLPARFRLIGNPV